MQHSHLRRRRRTRGPTAAAVCALVLATVGLHAAQSAQVEKPPLFDTRVVDVKVEGVSLERVDVSMQIAVRASRNVTIRTLTFSDGYIDRIPVWVAPVEGPWPLRKGEEFVIPPRVQVTLQSRDALASGGLASLLGRDAVDARATVEMSFDTPWMARMLRTATDVAITEVAFKAPVPASSPLMQPLARLGAGVIELLQRQAGPLLASGPGGQAATRDVLDRFGPSVATVETEYEIEGGPAPGRRTIKTLGLWWTPSIYCTTREAFEHSRYLAHEELPRVLRALNELWEECRVKPPATFADLSSLIETLSTISAVCQRFDAAIFAADLSSLETALRPARYKTLASLLT